MVLFKPYTTKEENFVISILNVGEEVDVEEGGLGDERPEVVRREERHVCSEVRENHVPDFMGKEGDGASEKGIVKRVYRG